jgi:hypothetical protein
MCGINHGPAGGAFFIFWHFAASSLRKNMVFCISSPILLHHILGEKKLNSLRRKLIDIPVCTFTKYAKIVFELF